MNDTSSIVTFIIAAFVLAGIVVLRKDRIPQGARKRLALIALLMVVCAFALLVYTIFRAGQ